MTQNEHVHLTPQVLFLFFFFNDTATTEIYTLSLHDALPISLHLEKLESWNLFQYLSRRIVDSVMAAEITGIYDRSEEHTSELQSLAYLVCRLLLEKKKTREGLPSLPFSDQPETATGGRQREL